eukprot:4289892-Amphidinium_carterae.5
MGKSKGSRSISAGDVRGEARNAWFGHFFEFCRWTTAGKLHQSEDRSYKPASSASAREQEPCNLENHVIRAVPNFRTEQRCRAEEGC